MGAARDPLAPIPIRHVGLRDGARVRAVRPDHRQLEPRGRVRRRASRPGETAREQAPRPRPRDRPPPQGRVAALGHAPDRGAPRAARSQGVALERPARAPRAFAPARGRRPCPVASRRRAPREAPEPHLARGLHARRRPLPLRLRRRGHRCVLEKGARASARRSFATGHHATSSRTTAASSPRPRSRGRSSAAASAAATAPLPGAARAASPGSTASGERSRSSTRAASSFTGRSRRSSGT